MPPQPQPSIKDLVNKTVADAQRLAKAQAALFKTEVADSGTKVGIGGALGLATMLIAVFALLFLLLTLAFVLVALGLPIWAGMLIVAVLLIIIAAVTAFIAKRNFESATPPTIALAELEKTKAALSGKPLVEAPDVPGT
jgi:Flp pilus assembly protein TadB